MKHTPGIWWFDGREVMIAPRGDIKICRVYPISEKDDGKANARLIAAAPEILIALKHACAYLDDCEDPHDPTGEQLKRIVDKGIKAIQKATGAN